MNVRHELELLDQVQTEAELMGEEAEELTGLARREFVFLSLVSAAASTFGFGARTGAGWRGRRGHRRTAGRTAGSTPSTRQWRADVVDLSAMARRYR